jgi:hypothetical protein
MFDPLILDRNFRVRLNQLMMHKGFVESHHIDNPHSARMRLRWSITMDA